MRRKRALERAERDLHVAAQDRPQTAGARAARAPRQHRLHLTRRRAMEHTRLVAGAGERPGLQHRGQVDERARDGCDRDAEHHGRLARVETSTAAGDDALNAPFAPRRPPRAEERGRGTRGAGAHAARPQRSAPTPHAATAARYVASRLGAWCPTRYTPGYSRSSEPERSRDRTSAGVTPAASRRRRVTTPCRTRANSAITASTVLSWCRTATPRQDGAVTRPGTLRRPRRRGGVATQRPAKPFTPVRFRSAPWTTTGGRATARRGRPWRGSLR